MGKLEKIWLKENKGEPMVVVEEVNSLANQGLLGNTTEMKHRQVTILSAEDWSNVEKEFGFAIDPIIRRANFLVTGVQLKKTKGKLLNIGSMRIEITGETKPCQQMDTALAGLQAALSTDWRGGAHGTILNDTSIRIGDPVTWNA